MSRKPGPATLERVPTRTNSSEPAPQIMPSGATTAIARPSDDPFGPHQPSKQAIRDRAYQIYLARNGAPGDAESDWAAAERELREEYQRRFRGGRTS